MDRSVWVVIAAAGEGQRAQSNVPKQFWRVGSSTILEITTSRFLGFGEVRGIVIAVLPSGIPKSADLTELEVAAWGTKEVPVAVVRGGVTRRESVERALSAIPGDASWIAVHDGVRPHFTHDLFRSVFEAARQWGAAVPCLPVTDTIKSLPEPFGRSSVVSGTLPRDRLARAQTPQIFHAPVLRKAYRLAGEQGWDATDDVGLVERLGQPVGMVEGERENVKITYPEDMDVLFSWKSVTGMGIDVHGFAQGRALVVGGVTIPHDRGLLGHSDADVLVHAVMDAILGAMGEGDIGRWFPPDDPQYKDASSIALLVQMWKRLGQRARIVHLDTVIVAESPKFAPWISAMRGRIAGALSLDVSAVSIKATTTEHLGFLGREEGVAAFCVATLLRRDST